ncbi:unnamed protein product [Allacma fusca]|nr:unnamed protein product [Allacma fusca]
MLELQGYDFEVKYRRGIHNEAADCLSRMYENYMVKDVNAINRKTLITAQCHDSELSKVMSFCNDPSEVTDEWTTKLARDATLSQDGCLYKYVGSLNKPWERDCKFWRVWVPFKLIPTIIAYYHSETISGHMGISKTYKRIEERFYWKCMRKDIFNFVKNCIICQKTKAARTHKIGIGSSPIVSTPWENVSCDLLGPYVKGRKGYKYLLVVTCYATKYVELFGLRAATAANIIKKLWLVFLKWGFPHSLTTDNGTQFSSRKFLGWCISVGVYSWRIASYHPQSNPCERYNRTVKDRIVSQIEACKDWATKLEEVAFAVNSSINDSTGFSPAYLNFGRELRTPLDNKLKVDLSGIDRKDSVSERMQLILNHAKANTLASQKIYMDNYNKDKIKSSYKEGDFVFALALNISDASKGITSSLCKKYAGPFVISRMISDTVCELQCPNSKKVVGRVHVSRLKPGYLSSTEDHGLV